MNTINSSHTHSPGPEWQLLGELELPVGVSTNDVVHAWLTELLSPRNLSTDFLNRVLKSAQDSATRALHPNIAMDFGHIHLSIYVPHERVAKGKTWGYFHIERIENRKDDIVSHDHAIDFYLYMEGE